MGGSRSRWLTLALVVAMLGGGVVGGAFMAGRGATAQDNLEERVADLEMTVADQDETIADLEDAVADLDERIAALEDPVVGGAAPVGGGDLTFEGSGDNATEPFELPGGSYMLAFACDGGFQAMLDITALGSDEWVFSTLVGSPPYTGSEVLDFDGGRYVMSVSCQGAWSIELTALS